MCKTQFKYALRQCKYDEETLRADALAKKLANKSYDSFWKEVKFVNGAKLQLPENIGDVHGAKDIANMWKEYFGEMFNLYGRNSPVSFQYSNAESIKITAEEVFEGVKMLSCGKSPGPDGLVSEHYKLASPKLYPIIARLISSMFVHGYMPENLIRSALVPIVKNKCKSLTAKDNYRPVALANTFTKIIEHVIIGRIDVYLWTSGNQFGFQKGASTDQCIYVLKELINSYLVSGSSKYCCFLDASKAFDRVNHGRLMTILLDRGVPDFIVRLLCYWYSFQTMYIRWGSVTSDAFHVYNGVRQGGILSPLLFNVYV